MGYIGVTTHLLTIDPNFQRDIQVPPEKWANVPNIGGHFDKERSSDHAFFWVIC